MPKKPEEKRPAEKAPAHPAHPAHDEKHSHGHSAADASRIEALRRILTKKREDAVRQMQAETSRYLKGEGRETDESAMDDGDLSVKDHDEALKLKHLDAHRIQLIKIDESLRKIEEGTYGLCEDCGDEINSERLRILPFAIRCRDCQEAEEERESSREGEGIIYDL